DHAEIGDGLADLAAQAFGELVVLEFLLADRMAGSGGGHGVLGDDGGKASHCSRAFLRHGSRRKLGASRCLVRIAMSETADIVQQISALRCEHRELDEAIARMTEDLWKDQIQLTRMKKRKLKVKD